MYSTLTQNKIYIHRALRDILGVDNGDKVKFSVEEKDGEVAILIQRVSPKVLNLIRENSLGETA